MARPEVTGRKPHASAYDDGDDTPPIPPGAFSIRQFCKAHAISEDMFYKMQREKWGPTTMKVGSRTLISHEAAAEWRRAREAAAKEATEAAATAA
jgi:hypothetical protein